MIKQIIREEIRSNLGRGKKYQFLDMGGATFGLFFIFDSINRLRKPREECPSKVWAGTELVIGLTMFSVHSLKFFFKEEMEAK